MSLKKFNTPQGDISSITYDYHDDHLYLLYSIRVSDYDEVFLLKYHFNNDQEENLGKIYETDSGMYLREWHTKIVNHEIWVIVNQDNSSNGKTETLRLDLNGNVIQSLTQVMTGDSIVIDIEPIRIDSQGNAFSFITKESSNQKELFVSKNSLDNYQSIGNFMYADGNGSAEEVFEWIPFSTRFYMSGASNEEVVLSDGISRYKRDSYVGYCNQDGTGSTFSAKVYDTQVTSDYFDDLGRYIGEDLHFIYKDKVYIFYTVVRRYVDKMETIGTFFNVYDLDLNFLKRVKFSNKFINLDNWSMTKVMNNNVHFATSKSLVLSGDKYAEEFEYYTLNLDTGKLVKNKSTDFANTLTDHDSDDNINVLTYPFYSPLMPAPNNKVSVSFYESEHNDIYLWILGKSDLGLGLSRAGDEVGGSLSGTDGTGSIGTIESVNNHVLVNGVSMAVEGDHYKDANGVIGHLTSNTAITINGKSVAKVTDTTNVDDVISQGSEKVYIIEDE